MERTELIGAIAVVLLWVAIVAIVLILLSGAAAAMVWDPNSRRRARVIKEGTALPVTKMRTGHEIWPRRH
jgi:flagellar basal body-associated protein FliL